MSPLWLGRVFRPQADDEIAEAALVLRGAADGFVDPLQAVGQVDVAEVGVGVVPAAVGEFP
jgi:hypothetical protein